MSAETTNKHVSTEAEIKAEAMEKVKAEKLASDNAAKEATLKAQAEAKARRELELAEQEEQKQAKEKAEAKARKIADEAVAKAKKAATIAAKLQSEADRALAALDESKIKGLIMKNEVALNVAVPGHPEIKILKKFLPGEKVTRAAFVKQIMSCGLGEYTLVE